MTIGVLAVQGGFALHERKFDDLGVCSRQIIYPGDLDHVDGLVIPGGESSTILKFINGVFFEAIKSFAEEKPVWGICAGAIIAASEVECSKQKSLGLLAITVARNAYGTQNESFIAEVPFDFIDKKQVECIFIRAPKITSIGPGVTSLALFDGDIIMVEDGLHMATIFHPELTDNLAIHDYYLKKVKAAYLT